MTLQGDTTIDIDGGGAVSLESSGGAINVGADAVAQAVNIGTGAAARAIAIGNAASASLTLEGGVGGIDIDCDTTFDVLAGGAVSIDGTGASNFTADSGDLSLATTTTGSVLVDGQDGVAIESAAGELDIGADAVAQAVNIATGAAARAIVIGNAASASLDMEGGVGAATLQADTTIDIDAGGALGIESSGGAINIGADAVAQAVNIGTGAAARAIAIGNAASASLALEGGVGGIDIDCDTTFDVLAGGAFSIDGTGASNVSATSGQLTLSTITSGDVLISSAASVLLRAASGSDLQFQDDADNTKITVFDSASITAGNSRTLTMADENVNLGVCIPRLISKTVTTTELTASATSQEINFDSAVPANAMILSRGIHVTTVFSGGGASNCTADFGDGVDDDGYYDGEDIFTGAATGHIPVPTVPGALLADQACDVEDAARTPSVTVASDVNVDTLTAGSVTAYVLYLETPLGAVMP